MFQTQVLHEAEIERRLARALCSESRTLVLEFPQIKEIVKAEPRPAAVLILLLVEDSAWNLLLTRRSAELPEHSGQVAFPGGRSDPEDRSPEETALREAEEEIGLKRQDVRILGRLPDYHTITNYLVTPFVGSIPWPYALSPAANEVTRIFKVPLDWLADPANHETRFRPLPAPHPAVPVVYFHPYDGEVLWGASARLSLTLINTLQNPG